MNMALFRCGRLRFTIVSVLLLGNGPLGRRAAAQEQPTALRVEQSAINATVGGLHVFVPEKWSALDLVVSNPFDEPREVLTATYFDEAPTLQYGRRLWVPARARLATWAPVLLPRLPPSGDTRFGIHSVVFDPTQRQEVLQREDAGTRLHSGTIPARLDRPITGFLGTSVPGDGKSDPAFDLVIAGRLSKHQSRRIALFNAHTPIPDDFGLQGVDQLVISNEQIHEDVVRLPAIRRWMHAGGSLWIMLDVVDPLALERIAGDEFRCHVVDRVGLTSVRIDSTRKDGSTAAVEADYEQPVDLVRVVLADSDVQVEHTVNGWPAAFWKSFGAGRLLVTTLGARGWLRERVPDDPSAVNRAGRARASDTPTEQESDMQSQAESRFVLPPPMTDLANEFFMIPVTQRSSILDAFETQAAEYIGYSIPPRWQIAGLLIGLGGSVVTLGVWLGRKRALEHLGWSGPALSLGVSSALLIIGGLNRHAIPATVAVADMVHAISGTDDIWSQGAVVFFRSESGRWEISSTDGGRLLPDMTGQEGTTRRLVWSDLDAWSWQNLYQTAPQRSGRFDQARTLPHRIEAQATAGPDGLSGRLSIPATMSASDPILATRIGQLAVDLAPGGSIRVAADGVLVKDQYLAAGVLSDEQNRRRRTNELVLQNLRGNDLSSPLLLFWADQRLSDFQYEQGQRRLGASLVAVPLRLERPPVNTVVRIPSPLLGFRSTYQPGGQPSSPIWDNTRHQWQEYPGAASAWLKFQLPRELLPLELTRGRLVIRVTGPLGRLEVFGLYREPGDVRTGAIGGQPVSIHTWDQPVGTLPVPLDDSNLLRVGNDGSLVLGLAIKGPERLVEHDQTAPPDEKPSYWRIEELSLELTGKVVEP
jgi:hypothetical protein